MSPAIDTSTQETTETRIRRAATELFYEQGYHATTMRDIASRVGIKAGSLYNHFPGKQDILVQISLQTTRELQAGAVSRLEGVEDAEEGLRAYLQWHVVFHAKNRLASRVADGQLHALSDENRRAVVEVRDAHEQLLTDLLRRGVDELGWEIADQRVIAIGIATMCTEVDAWFRDDGPLSAEQVGEIFADFILKGLRGGTSK
jgi:TetR/AcrR family transcriptional regulator, cholesterol catabolism regulator